MASSDGERTALNLDLPQRYQLAPDPVLGQGGMGRVLKAHDRVLDVPVALKVIRPDRAEDDRFRRLFDLEVRISARFDHPHVVPLHDHGVTDSGIPFLGLAFADAGSFARYRTEVVDWTELTRLTLQLLDALGHLHARGVFHRDLKPENVLLHTGPDGQVHVWLADLGLASAASDLARVRGRTEGTPGFMAPEQRLGLPREYGPWTDLYALGVILWEITTGARPFADHQTALDGPLPAFRPRPGLELPTELPNVLANLLCPEPLSRYDLVADLVTELVALSESTLSPHTQEFDPDAPLGTVAPAAEGLSSDIELVDPAVAETSDLFQVPTGEVRTADFDPNVPAWNRPLPDWIPADVPPERTRELRAAASPRLFALRETRLVGRDAVRQELWDHATTTARERKPRIVLVIGESGAGKARLVDSIAYALEEGGWAETVHLQWQRQESADDGFPGAARALLRPWNETRASLSARLRRRLARERGRYGPTIKKEADTLARWCGLTLENEDAVPEGLGLREIYRHVEARTWRCLACLVLSDVGWCRDEGDGLAIAEALLASEEVGVEGKPLLVIATLRKEQLHEDRVLAERVAALQAAGAHTIELDRLDRDATLALLSHGLRLSKPLAERVVERCEGNPLFARQLIMEWTDRGWLVDRGDLTFHLAPGVDPDAVLPRDAADLFDDRVERLCEASGAGHRFRDAVHMAALAGRTVPRDLVLDLAGASLQDFVLGCGLYRQHDEWLSVDGKMLHQAVLNRAEARDDLAYLHRRVGKAWVRYAETTGADVAQAAARHAAQGQDWGLAADQGLLAAGRAFARGRIHDLDETSKTAFETVRANEELWELWGIAALQRGRGAPAPGPTRARPRCLRGGRGPARRIGRRGGPGGRLVWTGVGAAPAGPARRRGRGLCPGGRGRPLGGGSAVRGRGHRRQGLGGATEAQLRRGSDPVRPRGEQAGSDRRHPWARRGHPRAGLRGAADGGLRRGARAVRRGGRGLRRARRSARAGAGRARQGLRAAPAGSTRRVGGPAQASHADVRGARRDADPDGDPPGGGRAASAGVAARIAPVGCTPNTWAGASGRGPTSRGSWRGSGWPDSRCRRAISTRPSRKRRGSWWRCWSGFPATGSGRPTDWWWRRCSPSAETPTRPGSELWSADELGLRDIVDADVVDGLERILAVAQRQGWTRVTRLAAKLLVPQLQRLGRTERAAAVLRIA